MAKAKKKQSAEKEKKPLTNGRTDRDTSGKFVNGNKASVGHITKNDRKCRELKKALIDAVTEEDIKAIVDKLVEKSKDGDVASIKELFDRLWGRAKYVVGEETISSLADIAARMSGNGTD